MLCNFFRRPTADTERLLPACLSAPSKSSPATLGSRGNANNSITHIFSLQPARARLFRFDVFQSSEWLANSAALPAVSTQVPGFLPCRLPAIRV